MTIGPVIIMLNPSDTHCSSLSLIFGSLILQEFHTGKDDAARFLIQFNAWPCGSIISGNLLDLVTKIPFCVDNGSLGNPSIFQSPIVPDTDVQ
jgi:hypothetical protein